LVQHLLGLGGALLLYLVLRRLGVRPWLAALGAAPILLDGYEVYLEQMVMAEALFVFLVVAVVAVLLWRDKPTMAGCIGGGLLVGAAAITRNTGMFVLVPAVGYVALRRAGWRRVVAMVGVTAVMLIGYASWYRAEHGHFALEGYDGYFIAGRVMPFADCRGLSLPPLERRLCDPRPVADRLGTDWYIWNPGTPLRDPEFPPGESREAVARSFGLRIIRHQPLTYLRTVLGDVAHYFEPGHRIGPKDNPVQGWQFRTFWNPGPWHPEYPPADPYVYQWTWPGDEVYYGQIMATHGFNVERLGPSLNVPIARKLASYQRHVGYTPGPLLAVAVLLGLGAGLG